MNRISSFRIFADHYQFWVCESEADPFDPLPDFTDESVKRGWSRTEYSICFSTQAHLNDHRLDIIQCETMPELNVAERITVHPLVVQSGITIFDIEEIYQLPLTPGTYSLILAAYNLGKEQDHNEDELEDEEFFKRLDWERYELYICPHLNHPEGQMKVAN